MKNVYRIAIVLFSAAVMVSCGDSFLTRDPYGSTITQGQYEQLANQLEGSMRGIYSMMYSVSDHDAFGKRSIDMYGDLMCGDMALTNYTYGWFYTDEQGQEVEYPPKRRITNGEEVFNKLDALVYEAYGRLEEFWLEVDNEEISMAKDMSEC